MVDDPDRPEGPEPTVDARAVAAAAPADGRGSRVARRRGRRRRVALRGMALVAVLVAVVVVLILAGGNDRTTKATARRSSVSSTTTTTPTTTTTTPAASGTGTTRIPRSSNPVVALAQQYDGRYVGMFVNTTFQTMGTATLDVRINPGSGVLAATVDLNGDLFGGGAKVIRRIEGSVTLGNPSASVTTQTSAFGSVTGKLGPGPSIVLTALDVPDAKVKTFELTGTLRSDQDGFDATFSVGFRDGRSAHGTVTVLCAPQGQRASDVTILCTPP